MGIMPKKFFKIIAIGIFFHLSARAQLVPNDHEYLQRTFSQHRLIYSSEYQSLADSVAKKYDWLNTFYSQEFRWTFDEDSVLVLASSKNQVANGFATQYPRLLTMFYDGGPEFIDDFAFTSWLDVLLSHETVHLYQLNVRKDYSSFLKKVFGNAQPGIAIPFTYMITPHLLTPTFLMEGNATFNESRFGNGGRLHSGHFRALFLQLLKAGKVTSNLLMNDRIDWPFGTEKYIVGGYFFSQLAEEFGYDQANRFFETHANRYAFPFRINATFRDLYDEGYEDVLEHLRTKYMPMADRQLQLSGRPLARSYEHTGFTRDPQNASEILFMTNSFRGFVKACGMTSAARLSCRTRRMPFGRLFKVNGQLASAASIPTEPTAIRAGLFTDGFKRLPGYDDKFVYQLSARGTIYADYKNSFDKVRVYKDGISLGDMQSSPLQDSQGRIYHFKQAGEKRQLFQDDKMLLEIEGHFGRVCDVDSEGRIYFTGGLESGSTLFRWDGKSIGSVVASDRVIDAKLLGSSGKILVAEITATGFEYRVTEVSERSLAPIAYSYLAKDDAGKVTSSASKPSTIEQFQAFNKSASDQKTTSGDSSYRPLHELEFNGVDPSYGSTFPGGSIWALNFRFSDPLQRYFLNFLVGDSGWNNYFAQSTFLDQTHRLQWFLTLLYEQKSVLEQWGPREEDKRVFGRYTESDFTAGVLYPLMIIPVESSIGLSYIYESTGQIDQELQGIVSGEYVNSANLTYDLIYSFKNFLDQSAYEAARFKALARYEGEGSDWERGTQVYRGTVFAQRDLWWQTYLKASYDAATTGGPRRSLSLDQTSMPELLEPTEFSQLSEEFIGGGFYQLRKANAELRQGIEWGLYHRSIPVGLRRLAPFVGYSEFYGTKIRGADTKTLFHEAYLGLELELLLLHKFPVRVELINADNSLDPESSLTLRMGYAKNF